MSSKPIGENFGLTSPDRLEEPIILGDMNNVVNTIIEFVSGLETPEDKRSVHGAFLVISLPGEPIEAIATKIAKTIEYPIVKFKLSEIIEENHLDKLLKYANTNAPCILYIPRLETIATSGSINALKFYEWIQSINLEESQIIVVAQSSEPESIDAEVISSFDLHIPLKIPDAKEREIILKQFFGDRATEVEDAVGLTDGWSYGDLLRLVKYVKLISKKTRVSLISAIKEKVLPVSQKYHRINLNRWGQGRVVPSIELIERVIPEDLIEQYYIMAVSENSNLVHRVIQNLNDGFPLDDRDQEFLAKYPFLLIGPPRKRIERLAAAKRHLNTIERLVGGNK